MLKRGYTCTSKYILQEARSRQVSRTAGAMNYKSKCPKCFAILQNSYGSCRACGQPIPSLMFKCPQCGKKKHPQDALCETCARKRSSHFRNPRAGPPRHRIIPFRAVAAVLLALFSVLIAVYVLPIAVSGTPLPDATTLLSDLKFINTQSANAAESDTMERIASLEHRVDMLEHQVNLLNSLLEIDLGPTPTLGPLSTAAPVPTPSPLPTTEPPPTAATSDINDLLVVHVERGNVRSGPGTDYSIVGAVHRGQIMRGPFDENNGWFRFCCLDGQPGWVSGTLVTRQTVTSSTSVTRPPVSLRSDSFYQKYLSVGDVPILAARNVSDEVLFRTQDIITAMLQNRPDLLYAMSTRGFRVGIYDYSSGDITQLPEVDNRFQGRTGIFTSTSYGAIAGVPNSVQHCNRVLIHEFAHAIYHAILRQPGGEQFKESWSNTYREAMASGLWIDEYASTNESEYWAETVTYWLMPTVFRNTFGVPFVQYDPTANQLIWQVFGHTSLSDFCDYGFVNILGTITYADGTPVEGIYVVPTLWMRLDGETRYIGVASARQKPGRTNQDGKFVIRQAVDRGVLESQAYFLIGFYRDSDPAQTSACSVAGWLHRDNYITRSPGSAILPVRRQNSEFSITVRKDFDWSPLNICR